MAIRTSVWDAWLAVTLGSFVALELYAYRTERFPTLSRVLRRHLGIEPRSKHGQVAPVAFAGFWIGLVVHLRMMEALERVEAQEKVCDLRDPALFC